MKTRDRLVVEPQIWRLALFFVLGIPLGNLHAQVPDIDPHTVERSVWSNLYEYKDYIIAISRNYNLDPQLIFSVLYVEKSQYELDAWLRMKQNLEETLSSKDLFFSNLSRWANLSTGYCNIKPEFSIETFERARKLGIEGSLEEDDFLPSTYIYDPKVAVEIMCTSFKIFIEQWRQENPDFDISQRPEIIATLYNIGYEHSQPKADPKSGGSTYPTILNGKLIENTPFGDRVLMVMNSSLMLSTLMNDNWMP